MGEGKGEGEEQLEARWVRSKRTRERRPTDIEAGGVDGELSAMFRHIAVWAYEDELRFLHVVEKFVKHERVNDLDSAAVRKRSKRGMTRGNRSRREYR